MPFPATLEKRPCKHGHVSGRGAAGRCLECDRLRKSGKYDRAKSRARYETKREEIKKQTNAYRLAHPEKKMLWTAGERARRGGYPCTITLTDIAIPEFCPLLGIRLQRGTGKPGPASPSLDKIRPELGYVPGNVWVTSARANKLKNDATVQELQMLTEGLVRVLSN